MSELNREQIIKNLERLVDKYGENGSYNTYCTLSDALALIKKLTEENERHRSDVVGQLEAEVYSSDKYINEYDGSEVQKAYNKGLRDALKIAKEMLEENKSYSWIITENGCVITCPNCGHRLELCYPDGTEVRYLPHCPWCGKKLEE